MYDSGYHLVTMVVDQVVIEVCWKLIWCDWWTLWDLRGVKVDQGNLKAHRKGEEKDTP